MQDTKYPKVIDGVKVLCIGTHYLQWEANPLLTFESKIDTTTGEVLSDNKIAHFKGLHFFLIPSTINNDIHCILRGSLAKYYNEGIDNAFDYNLDMLQETIIELHHKFHIDPFNSIIQNLEYGVNIKTVQPPKTIIRGLRAYQSDAFDLLRMDEIFTGKQIQKQEYQYKVYDKGLQTPGKIFNLLRVEIAIKSTKKAKKYGIEVLADLLELKNLNAIKPDLLKIWESAIFYDSGMNWRAMNKKQKEKMLYYLDATNWQKFNRKQRFRAKNIFIELRDTFCKSKTQQEILLKIEEKLIELEAEKGNALRNLYIQIGSKKKERFTHLNKGVKRTQKDPLKIANKLIENCVKISLPKCKVCDADISHKKEGSRYCSKKCNNSMQAKNRRKARRQKRTIEENNYTRLIQSLNETNLLINIYYKKNVNHSAHLQKHISYSKEELMTIERIELMEPEKIKLTSYRARMLIKTISGINNISKECLT